jgi:hypothetical protein
MSAKQVEKCVTILLFPSMFLNCIQNLEHLREKCLGICVLSLKLVFQMFVFKLLSFYADKHNNVFLVLILRNVSAVQGGHHQVRPEHVVRQ